MDAIVERILQIIDERRAEILRFARDIYNHAELGYREVRTSAAFVREMERLGLPMETGLAITGVKARLSAGRPGAPTVALLGEMDALPIPTHAHVNPETGAAHCCGHHCQLAGVFGAALALCDPAVRAAMDGDVVFFAVPSEEYTEMDFKRELLRQGRIGLIGGKGELLRLGAFDDIDLCVAHHTGFQGIQLGACSHNGFVSKAITITGKTAHSAAAPHEGINAMAAASLGMQALAMNRETFRDEDCVRVQPVITESSHVVNAVPDHVLVDTLVRGKTIAAIQDASRKTDRSFDAGAMALGASCTIETAPGYLPCLRQETPDALFELVREALPEWPVARMPLDAHTGGSSDVGDLQHVKPVLSFKTGGCVGGLHSDQFDVVDEEEAYIVTAKLFALHAYGLLRDGAALTRQVCETTPPPYPDVPAYLTALRQLVNGKENA